MLITALVNGSSRHLVMASNLNRDSREQLLRSARRFHPSFVSITDYINQVNTNNPLNSPIDLTCSKPNSHYERLLETLFVVQSSKVISNTLDDDTPLKFSKTRAVVSIKQTISQVITCSLRKHNPSIATRLNVLCAGFSLAHQDGRPSQFRNLDVKSREGGATQELAKVRWLILNRLIGQEILFHLLSHCILLLALFNKTDSKWCFLQICGPDLSYFQHLFSKRYCQPRSDSVISVKRDLLYHVPPHRNNLSKTQNNSKSASSSCTTVIQTNSSPNITNDGLPKTFHLQILPKSISVASQMLLPLIFCHDKSNKNSTSLSLSKHNQSNNAKESSSKSLNIAKSTSTYSYASVRNYDVMASKILSQYEHSERGKKWFAIQKSTSNNSKRLQQISPLLKTLISNYRKHSFRRVLGRICPLSPGIRHANNHKRRHHSSSHSMQDLIKMSISTNNVIRFLHSCCTHLIPFKIFGSKHNLNILQQGIREFIERRQLNESFNIHQYFKTRQFKLKDVEWLYNLRKKKKKTQNLKSIVNPTDFKFRQMKLNDFMVWIFRGFIIPLLQQNFFMTEGNLNKNKVFFYRREVWVKLIDATNHSVLRKNGQFSILSKDELKVQVQRRKQIIEKLGKDLFPFPVLIYHDMRYIPKKSSLRRIQRPRCKMLNGFSCVSETPYFNNNNNYTKRLNGTVIKRQKHKDTKWKQNSMKGLRCFRLLMNQILSVLRCESRKDESILGASVFSLDDIYKKWIKLKQEWLKRGRPKMYLCCVDVAQSFDTIPLKILCEDIIPPLLKRSQYPIIKLKVNKINSIDIKKFICRIMTYVCIDPGDNCMFPKLIQTRLVNKHSCSLFSDMASNFVLDKNDIQQILKEFIMSNLIIIPKRCRRNGESGYAKQVQGVPQGHPLSPILTSLFYGHVEKNELSEFFNQNGNKLKPNNDTTSMMSINKGGSIEADNNSEKPSLSLLMRLVDDTMYISSDESQSNRFLSRMIQGWKTSHGFAVNADKTRASFEANVGGTENVRLMPWCGLLIDSNTLEIRNDYSRYSMNNTRLRDYVTIEHEWENGRIWNERCLGCFNPKLHPLLLDGHINGTFTICVNIYQAAVLCCLKACTYLMVMDNSNINKNNVQFMTTTFTKTCINFTKLVMNAMTRRIAPIKTDLKVSKADVYFLTCSAFRECVNRKLQISSKDVQSTFINTSHNNFLSAKEVLQRREGSDVFISTVIKIGRTCCAKLWEIRS